MRLPVLLSAKTRSNIIVLIVEEVLVTGSRIVRKDFTVQPRFSQSLHPKGHKGDVTYNTSDHTGDGA